MFLLDDANVAWTAFLALSQLLNDLVRKHGIDGLCYALPHAAEDCKAFMLSSISSQENIQGT